MSEAQEVAAAMLPKFLAYLRINNKFLPHDKRPLAEAWVHSEMRESQQVMDNVIDELIELISHRWVQGMDVGLSGSMAQRWMCKNCGNLRCKNWPKYPETACKGKVKVGLRDN